MAYGDNRSEVASDTFDSSIDSNWENGPNGFSTCSWVTGGHVEAGSSGTETGLRRNTGTYDDDQYCRFTVQQHGGSDHYISALCRLDSGTDACYTGTVETSSDGYEIAEFSSGPTYNTLASTSDPGSEIPHSAGDIITLEAEGTTLRMGSDQTGSDLQKVTTTDATVTSGRPGLNLYYTGAVADARITAWSGGSISAGVPAGNFVMPTPNNVHEADPDATPGNLRHLTNIGTITAVSAKANGNLPITQTAGQYRNNGTTGSSVTGLGYEFQASQAAWDVSSDTRLMVWHCQHNAPNRIQVDTVANGGERVRIYSGTGSMPTNYKEYYLGGRDTPFSECIKGHVPFIIDLNDTSEDVENGTFDNTDVTSYAYLTLRNNMAGSNDNWNYMSKLWVVQTTKASADTPHFTGDSDWNDAVTEIQGTDYTDKVGNFVRQIGDVVFYDLPFKIGDNSTQTQFDDLGATVISPVHNDSADPRIRVTTQAFRAYLNLRNNAGDTADFSGTYIWQVRSPWDFDQDDSAVVTFATPTFRGMGEFTLGSSITGPAVFDDVDAVIFADTGVDIDGSVFRNQNGNHALEMTAGAMDIADMRFESYASAHAILIDTAGTYNFSNVFFDQSGTNDIETTHASGTVTINISNGGTVPTVTETGAGTVVINNNVTVRVTVTDLSGNAIEGARVRLISDETVGTITAGDEIMEGLTNASGIFEITNFNYESAFDPSGLDVSGFVAKGSETPTYKRAPISGTILPGGLSIPVSMVGDD